MSATVDCRRRNDQKRCAWRVERDNIDVRGTGKFWISHVAPLPFVPPFRWERNLRLCTVPRSLSWRPIRIMSSPSQPTISSYFSPPARRKGTTKGSPIDLTTDDEEPPRKKFKVASRESSAPPLKARSKPKPPVATRRKNKSVSEEVEELSGDDSDPQFKALTAMFKQKKIVVRRDGNPSNKPKVQDDIGPSGQSYTPLEKQVSLLRAIHLIGLHHVLGPPTEEGERRCPPHDKGRVQV